MDKEKIYHSIFEIRDAIFYLEQEVNELHQTLKGEIGMSNLIQSRDPKDLTPFLQEKWSLLKNEYEDKHKKARFLNLSCTYRPPEVQYQHFMRGRDPQGNIIDKANVVTYADGYKNIGAHNHYPSFATDVYIVDSTTNAAIWDGQEYEEIGIMGETLGLVWGGRWENLKDFAHFEEKGWQDKIKPITTV